MGPLRKMLLPMSLVVACGGSETKVAPPTPDEVESEDYGEMPDGHRARGPMMDDDDDDDGVEIEGLRGHLSPYDIDKGIKPHSTALAMCFQSNAKKKSYLGGDVELAFTIARDGSVKSVRAMQSSVGSWTVERCLLDESKTMTFAKPKGGEADFTLPLEFESRRSTHWWSEEKADAELKKLPAELKSCRAESGSEPRNVWVTLYLGNRGIVQSAGFASPNEQGIDVAWADCAVAKITAWTLTDPRGKIAKLGFRYNPE